MRGDLPIMVVASEKVASGKPLVFAVLAPAINGSLQKGSQQIQLLICFRPPVRTLTVSQLLQITEGIFFGDRSCFSV